MKEEERNAEIKHRRFKENWKVQRLADHYGLSINTISRICNPQPTFPRLRQDKCGFREKRKSLGVQDFIKLKVEK